jgi:hypothetical protein
MVTWEGHVTVWAGMAWAFPPLGIEMEGEMLSTVKVGLVSVTLFFCSSVGHAQQAQTLTQAVQLIGLSGLNENTKGKLTVINGTLRFIHSKRNADVALHPSRMLLREQTVNARSAERWAR